MIFVVKKQRSGGFFHRNSAITEKNIFGGCAANNVIVFPEINRRSTPSCFLDSCSGRIVNECRGGFGFAVRKGCVCQANDVVAFAGFELGESSTRGGLPGLGSCIESFYIGVMCALIEAGEDCGYICCSLNVWSYEVVA